MAKESTAPTPKRLSEVKGANYLIPIDHFGDQGSEIRLMFGSVADSVQDATRKEQLPWISSPLGGRFYSFNPE
jgi:hypothetical protein